MAPEKAKSHIVNDQCVHNCPKNAIHLKNEKSNARFRNPEVSVKDLVEANN